MNLLTKQKETHRLRKWTYGCCRGRVVRDVGKVMYTLQYSKWITNKNLLYSTWNSAQCYVPAWMRRGSGRMDTCVCMAESICYPPETVTFLLGYVHANSLVMSDSLQRYGLQAPLSMGFFRQEDWSGLPCPPPGGLPNPGIKPTSLIVSCIFDRWALYQWHIK